MNTLGRIPCAGDEVTYEGLALKVEKMSGRRPSVVLARWMAPAESGSLREGSS